MFSKELNEKYPVIVNYLSSAIKKTHMAQSYVFISSNTSAIERIAVDIAKILNCQKNKNASPCNECLNCKWLEKNEHPVAFLKIEPDSTSKKEQVKIESIRELLEKLTISSGFHRVIFFKKANLVNLSSECCNLLLKTVEEAPKNTIFIFASSTKDDILQTIVSRSQIIYLNSVYEFKFEKSKGIESKFDLNNISKMNAFTEAKKAQKDISEDESSVENFLLNFAFNEYEKMKHTSPHKYYKLYEKIETAHKKHKAFMSDKIVLEDLFLDLAGRTTEKVING